MILARLFAIAILTLASVEAISSPATPRIAVYERDPWLTVIGSDSPIFAAYETGMVVWWGGPDSKGGHYESTSLSAHEYSELVATFSAIDSLSTNYEFTDITDQPEVEIHVWSSGAEKSVTAYGSLRDEGIRRQAPSTLVALYDYVRKFHHEGSRPWSPEYVEVMIWPFENAKGKAAPWPKGWPDFNSPSTLKRRAGSFSIYLPYSAMPELTKLLSSSSGAIEINNKKWAADIRIPFPHEYPK